VWPYYCIDDEDSMNNALQVFGQHVKQLSFPNHVTTRENSKLISVTTLTYCINAVQLSLPTTKLNHEQLGKVMLHMEHLQSLEINWESDIKRLLELIALYRMNLKELTIVSDFLVKSNFTKRKRSWMSHWRSTGFVPPKLNIAVLEGTETIVDYIVNVPYSEKSSTTSPVSRCGQIRIYIGLKMPLDLVPVLPVYQVQFGQKGIVPLNFVSADICGFSESSSVLLTDITHCNKVIYKASLQLFPLNIEENCSISDFAEFITEFNVSTCDVYSDQLERLAIACPNLQRLNLLQSRHCLQNLKGLQALASCCHSLQGLNLMAISVKNVENQISLWEILSGMKLTHLGVDLCVLLPSVEEHKVKLIGLFQKCKNLQVLESLKSCDRCESAFVTDGLSILSCFPILCHFKISLFFHHQYLTALQDIFTSCKQLKYLMFTEDSVRHPLYLTPSPTYSCNLEQLHIESLYLCLPDNFMSSISFHGGLVHVVLRVRSVTSEGVMVLLKNSPNLLTFHVFSDNGALEDLDEDLEATFLFLVNNRKLFKYGSFEVARNGCLVDLKCRCKVYADLFSFWHAVY